jgi:predicted phosphodiesterase
MEGLTWLHISDWHQQAPDHDRSHVGAKLMEDIKRCMAAHPELSEIDFVVFSGDVANSGKEEEYEQALGHLFMPLKEATGLGDVFWERLLVVPGNHDLDRQMIEETNDEELRDPLGKAESQMEKREAINRYLTVDGDPMKMAKLMLLLRPFKNFRNFITEYVTGQLDELNKREPGYYQIRRIQKGGKRIGLVGFNSALLSYRNKDARGRTNDYGHLVIGEPPIEKALGEIEGDHIRIAVMHHPISWLTDFDRDFVEERLYDKCHFVLHGHQHLPRVHVIGSTIGNTVNIPAGTVYNRRLEGNPRYTNSYNFAHLDFGTRHGTVYLRRWDERRDRWVEDDDAAYQPDGRFHFIQPKSVEPSKERVYHRQVSSLVGKISERFCESHTVSLKSKVQTQDGARVVRQEIYHKVELADGEPETFTAEVKLSGNNWVVCPATRPDAGDPPDDLSFFKLNRQRVDAFEVQKNKISYAIELGGGKATIEYRYVLRMSTDDFFVLLLKRFTKHFRLIVEKDSELTYEFVKLGDIPARQQYVFSNTSDWYETSGELCRPEQGFIIQWYPR